MRTTSVRGLILALPIMLALGHAASAESFPSRPIHMLVAAAAGGNLDITARLFANKLSEILGQPVVVENRTGASGAVAAQSVARAEPDGYTIGAIANTFTIVPSVLRSAGYDPVKEFTGIGLMNWVPLVLITGPSVPAHSMQELVALAKANPNKYSYATGGVGSSTHLPAALLALRTGMQMTHVPYKGGNAPAYPDVMSGRVAFIIDPVSTAAPMVKAGQVRALGVTSLKRLPLLPDVPTFDETVAPGYDMALWTGLVVPAATPPDIVKQLHAAYLKAIGSPEITSKVAQGGIELRPSQTPEEFTKFIASERDRFAKIVQDTKIPIE
jgi:tripartite-type tricarboxylate transporter receptor subunit TctC